MFDQILLIYILIILLVLTNIKTIPKSYNRDIPSKTVLWYLLSLIKVERDSKKLWRVTRKNRLENWITGNSIKIYFNEYSHYSVNFTNLPILRQSHGSHNRAISSKAVLWNGSFNHTSISVYIEGGISEVARGWHVFDTINAKYVLTATEGGTGVSKNVLVGSSRFV